MPNASSADQYVLLPMGGLRANAATATPEARALLQSMSEGRQELPAAGRENVPVRVIDTIGADGPRLVEVPPESVAAIRALLPGLRLVPVTYYVPAIKAREQVVVAAEPAAAAGTITLRVVADKGGGPVGGAIVVAFTNFTARAGAQGVTDANGNVSLALGGSNVNLDRLYVYPNTAMWSLLEKGVTVSQGSEIKLHPIDLGYSDGLRHYYGNGPTSAGATVKVAVVDTGVDPHPDLVIDGGANTVAGENPTDFASNGEPHGTHVAGIIAARGTPPSGIRGVAPAVTLRAYRVFAKGSSQASSFAIAKAIDQAVADGCDLINMSLGGGSPDPVLQAAVEGARTGGSVCIIASGNDGAGVSFPASDAMAVAVGAVGNVGTFPLDSAEIDDVKPPYGKDTQDFVASFSNTGPELDLVGPGVGIISTFPGGYAEISGTSMACPAVTGVGARIVASMSSLGTNRDATRSAAIVKAMAASAKDLGFTPVTEGNGLPEPPA